MENTVVIQMAVHLRVYKSSHREGFVAQTVNKSSTLRLQASHCEVKQFEHFQY